ncbi:MAG: zinc ribbon domain-containing protein [Treponema sp.]|jgi:ssDNA-binding Zn-finger/Zn-ribbon topoisomerase 1|nr:zinc ribbon domain-containing protein [Treponema sp.]
MARSGQAKYFCENCGSEVAANARFCPHCGRFFSSVRCPQCGYTGGVNAFKKGCPRCHYAMTQEDIFGVPAAAAGAGKKKSLKKKNRKKLSRSAAAEPAGDEVPVWMYIGSVAVLILFFCIVLFQCGII